MRLILSLLLLLLILGTSMVAEAQTYTVLRHTAAWHLRLETGQFLALENGYWLLLDPYTPSRRPR